MKMEKSHPVEKVKNGEINPDDPNIIDVEKIAEAPNPKTPEEENKERAAPKLEEGEIAMINTINDLTQEGRPLEVKIKSSKGKVEGGWYTMSADSAGRVIVSSEKDPRKTSYLRSVSLKDLLQWQGLQIDKPISLGEEAERVKSVEKRVAYMKKTFGPQFESQEKIEIKKEIENFSPEEKWKLGQWLSTIGFSVEKKKNEYFAKVFSWIADTNLDEKAFRTRFCKKLGDGFARDSEIARKKEEDVKSGKEKHRLSNMGFLSRNLLRYGRVITDLSGLSLASPLRYVMMGGMMFTRMAEAGKEARLMDEDVIEKTRIGKAEYGESEEEQKQKEQDIGRAQEEAFRIYENAQKTGNVSAESLKKAYLANMPTDLQERLKNPSTANGFWQKIFRSDMERAVNKLSRSVEKIENNPKLSEEEKKDKIEKLIERQKKNLEDYDRILTQYGTVDELAMWGRYAQTAGKTVVAAMTIETLALSVEKIWENLSQVLHSPDIHTIETVTSPDAVVHKGEGIEHTLRRQIENNPELAKHLGFKGNVGDPKALHEFSGGAAHRIALEKGYVDATGENEIKVMQADKVAYEVKLDGNKVIVTEKTVDGKVSEDISHHKEPSVPENKTATVKEVDASKKFGLGEVDLENGEAERIPHLGLDKLNLDQTTITEPEATTKTTPEGAPESAKIKELKVKIEEQIDKETKISDNHTREALDIDQTRTNPRPYVRSGMNRYWGRHPRVDKVFVYDGREKNLPWWKWFTGGTLQHNIPGFSAEQNLFFDHHPEFASNPFHLTWEKIMETYEIHRNNVLHLFPENPEKDWGEIRNLKTFKFIDDPVYKNDPRYKPLINYLHKLMETTDLKPKSGVGPGGAETNESFIVRALQKATQDGNLDKLKIE